MTITLTLHDVSEDDVLVLNELAASTGKTAEAMHLDILKSALQHSKRRSFADVLCSMPNVGEDADFDARNLITTNL
jgi:antitoxin FitA